MYFFGGLAVEMNEMEEGIAPTDSRLRPDQRAMEETRYDDANRLKVKLEEKQREVRKKREAEAEKAKLEGETIEKLELNFFYINWFTIC